MLAPARSLFPKLAFFISLLRVTPKYMMQDTRMSNVVLYGILYDFLINFIVHSLVHWLESDINPFANVQRDIGGFAVDVVVEYEVDSGCLVQGQFEPK